MPEKIIITRDFKSKPAAPKSDFMNPAQRAQLKKVLIEKFTKIYGLSNPGYVKDKIDTFFNSKKPINSKTILELENLIKKNSLKYKSSTTKAPEILQRVSNKDIYENTENYNQSVNKNEVKENDLNSSNVSDEAD